MKAMLRGFNLVYGLWANFHKSIVIGINVNPHFLLAAVSFLSCRIESKDFMFLGIPIGINPLRIKPWNFLVDKVSVRLSKLKVNMLSLGERITLIKSVMSNISIFLLSFY